MLKQQMQFTCIRQFVEDITTIIWTFKLSKYTTVYCYIMLELPYQVECSNSPLIYFFGYFFVLMIRPHRITENNGQDTTDFKEKTN
jgi:hypothetical protein